MTPDSGSPDDHDDRSLHEIPLSLDALLDILASHRRRALLEYLWEQPQNTGSFEEATEHTILEVGRKHGRQPNHDDVRIELQHQHLPKMADAGVIEYDVRSQTIRYHENERLETAYDRVRDFTLD